MCTSVCVWVCLVQSKTKSAGILENTPCLRRCATLPDGRPSLCSLTSTSSTEDDNLIGCTPALRRRRQCEKYVTDSSQLNLRFQRPKQRRPRPSSELLPRFNPCGVPTHLLGEVIGQNEESSDNDSDSSGVQLAVQVQLPPPPPSTLPPHAAENNARLEMLKFSCNVFCYLIAP
jgi:tau tubulin kinase